MIKTTQDLTQLANKKRCSKKCQKQEIRVCIGSSCLSLGADKLQKDLKDEIEAKNLTQNFRVKSVGCNGLCANGILISHYNALTKKETLYEKITASDVKPLIKSIKKGNKLKNKLCDTNQPFFTKQTKIVLENAGVVDPNDIQDYIAYGGYSTLFKAINEMLPQEIIDEIKLSKLRGRGGGGYPTGLKFETVTKVQSKQKYIICNGDEGDPGAYMDRALMEADPHRIIEGMIITAYACGASKGFIYVRAEYPIAVQKLKKAIKQASKHGLLGNNIANSNFCFTLEIKLGGGAFVCGEATALVKSIEGSRGNPRQKPPHLSNHGLWGEPTVLNNVETFANIVPIIKNGAKWFKSFGTENSTGTKVFALTGNINNTGLVEVPMGTKLSELIYEIGGGIPKNRELKAVQTGGPSGGCIPKSLVDIKVDYDSLKEVGSIMGSGGMIVMDDRSNMVEIAHFFMDFCKSESCGKCTPCRVGTTQLKNLLEKFVKKQATKDDYILLKEMCKVVKESSLCGLGQTAPNPVLSTIKYFEDEYLGSICDD